MPDMGYRMDGWHSSGEIRIRSTIFGCRIEELFEHKDGSRQWRRAATTVKLCPSFRERLAGATPPPAKND